VAAARAADRLERLDVERGLVEVRRLELLGGQHGALLAVVAQPPRQALGDDDVERGRRQERGDAHLRQSRDRGRRVVRVQRREDEVARQRRLDRDLRVSVSRISPTITMSGSARRIERRPVANVRPDLRLTRSG